MGLVEISRVPWFPLRTVAADDTFLTTYEWNNSSYTDIMASFTDKPAAIMEADEGIARISQDVISPVIAFWGKDAANKTATYKLYGRRRGEGWIEQLAAGEITLGATVVTVNPITKATVTGYWADQVTNTLQWIKPVTPLNAGADDTPCYLAFNGFGLKDLAIMFDLDGGSGADTTEMSAIITGA